MITGNIPGKTQTMPIAIFFEAEGENINQSMLWVMIMIGLSSIVIEKS